MLRLVLLLNLCPLLLATPEYFDSVPALTCCCNQILKVSAQSESKCAVLSSRSNWSRSFGFSNGVCGLSASDKCAVNNEPTIFKKQTEIQTPADHSKPVPGYELQVGNRLFWVFQQRLTGDVLFNRTWDEYVLGFGNVSTDFWAGLTLINEFGKTNRTIRIEMTTVDNEFYWQESANFTVGNASTNYTMHVDQYNAYNTSSDVLYFHSGSQFSTIDIDNDLYGGHCASERGGGGFWWANCQMINPNGFYSSTVVSDPSSNFKYVAASGVQSYKTLQAIKMMLQL
ncbi:hypothetical protein BOX15_Mlig025725g1 [Macrostomum lignano]|uniref:Fibrinogen C-terminal domain-containing protein n=2 Tax=Macrostomum lignano TaxID=282301 RepID=A0A1I8GC77_9PLAT|nr:hypothetical protein BOX15_Mlig025725g1 [Macrostomum lignano]